MRAAATAATTASGSSSTRTFAPTRTVSTHSVDGRRVTQGTPYQYASFWSPPESVRITRACDASAASWRYPSGAVRETCCSSRRPKRSSASRVRGWAGKTTGSVEPVQPVDDPAQPARPTLASRWTVATRYEPGSSFVGNRLARNRHENARGVGHHVPDDLRRSRPPLLAPASRASPRRGRAGGRRARRPRSGCAPPASRGRRCGAPPRCAPAPHPPSLLRGPRRESCSCRRRRPPSPAAPRATTSVDSALEHLDVRGPQIQRMRRLAACRARRRRPPTSPRRSAGPSGAETSSIPASARARESGAALMNWGRLPTIVRTLHTAARGTCAPRARR